MYLILPCHVKSRVSQIFIQAFIHEDVQSTQNMHDVNKAYQSLSNPKFSWFVETCYLYFQLSDMKPSHHFLMDPSMVLFALIDSLWQQSSKASVVHSCRYKDHFIGDYKNEFELNRPN